jgi:sulfocyanin
MYVGAKKQHVVIKMVAAATPNNSGFNFDGYAKGHATFVVPLGWNVEFEFSNKAALPHSLAIASNLGTPPKLPYFGIAHAETRNAMAGIGPGVTQVVGLSAVPAGKYYLVCMVPGHIQAGMWDYLTISATAKMPSMQTGTSKAGSSS